ncbi:hypothetical protein N7461_004589 [Penicillium sp. DV-2018c]|nr:hypothetical protein N7461_004589 [Penicillium sp. DV-2018c]
MLSELPTELLLSIASYLDDHKNTLRLASSCRAFYSLLLPTAYASLDLTSDLSGDLSLLVETLARKPALAQAVRTLSVSHWHREPGGRNPRYEQETILPVLKSVLAPDKRLWIWEWVLERYDDAAWDAWTTLLVSLLPNLQDLTLDINDFSTYTLKWMAKVAQEESSALSKLRNLTVTCENLSSTRGGFSSSLFLPLFRLPSLRSFCGHMIIDDDMDDEWREYNALVSTSHLPENIGYSNVTEIHLRTCYSLRGFEDFINAPKRLESFIFEYEFPESLGIHRLELMCRSRYFPPLSRHRETLHTLRLTDGEANNCRGDYEFFGSLTGFSALKNLQLPTYQILDWDRGGHVPDWGLNPGWSESDIRKTPKIGFGDVLPPSLETLILDNLELEHTTGLAKAFKDLLLGGKHRCPNPTYLEIKGDHMYLDPPGAKLYPIPPMSQEFAECKSEIEGLCLAAGVSFCFRDLSVETIIQLNFLRQLRCECDAL